MTVLEVENLGKQYRLGTIGTGTVSQDFNRWVSKIRGKEDPFLKIGETNVRSEASDNNYVWALQDVSFKVEQGEVLGIIGKNGAGKSTLLKLLSRVTGPTVGSIKARGKIASLLEVGTGFHPELTGRENIFLNGAILGMRKSEIKLKFDEIVEFSGVARYIDTPVKRYSSGMYVRLAFAVAAHLEPEILIVDEVLAVGDAEFQKKCLGKMREVSSEGKTVLFVSHNMGAVNNLCSRALLLENGGLIYEGSVDSVVSKYLDVFGSKDLLGEVQFENDTNKKFQIVNAKLLDANNQIISKSFDVKDPFKVEINYRIRELVASMHLTLVINNDKGETVYFLDRTDFAGGYMKAEVGNYSTVLSVPNPMFKPGKYSVTLGCSDNNSGVDDHKHNVMTFEIQNASAFRSERPGSLFIPLEWKMNHSELAN